MRVCTVHGCPTLYEGKGSRCPTHTAQADKARGTTTERGYGASHQRTRAQWAPVVAQGKVKCWRCSQPISPTEPWDIGHDDNDRTIYRGPEHANRCNRAAAGRSSHQ